MGFVYLDSGLTPLNHGVKSQQGVTGWSSPDSCFMRLVLYQRFFFFFPDRIFENNIAFAGVGFITDLTVSVKSLCCFSQRLIRLRVLG